MCKITCWSILTLDGSKIGGVYAVARERLLRPQQLFLNQISSVPIIDVELKTGKI